jgi:hypothetical protein
MILNSRRLITLAAAAALAGMAHGQGFHDFAPNDPSQPTGWNTDRFAPSTFSVGAAPDNNAQYALDLGVSNNGSSNAPFYHYNGDQKSAVVSGDWTVSGSVYVSAADVAGATDDTELWVSDAAGAFGSIAFVSGAGDNVDTLSDSSLSDLGRDGLNPDGQWSIYDNNTGLWTNLGSGITAGWHTLSIDEVGGIIGYSVDGNFLGSELGAGAGDQTLQTVYLESNNYGAARDDYWQDVQATPEPCTLLGLGAAGLAFIRRRKRTI